MTLDSQYINWWIANRNSIMTSLTNSGIQGLSKIGQGVASGAVIGGPVGAVAGGLLGGASSLIDIAQQNRSLIAKKEYMKALGNTANIPQSSNALITSTKNVGFMLFQKHLRNAYMKTIDDYFSLYGYRISEIKTPNIMLELNRTTTEPHYIRQRWNYIQTNGCNIHSAQCPASVITEIEKIYDKGITFWNDLNEIGNYKNLSDNKVIVD